MFKFFRKYNKWLLVIGGTMLMIVFLLPAGGNFFQPSARTQPIGTLDGRKITFTDQARAVGELNALKLLGRRASGTEGLLTGLSGIPDDPLAWMLALHEAEKLGLSASELESRNVLGSLGIDDAAMAQLAAAGGATPDTFVHVIRRWLMVQRYRELMLGLSHLSPTERIERIAGIIQFVSQFGQQIPNLDGIIQMQLMAAQGSPRFSEPLAQHMIANSLSQAQVALVAVPASRHEADVQNQPLDPTLVQALFETYRDALPGLGLPPAAQRAEATDAPATRETTGVKKTFRFGYRTPDRVRIEYLTIDFAQLLARAQVDFAQAMAYYNENPGQFLEDAPAPPPESDSPEAPPPAPKVRPFDQVRNEIVTRLREQQAFDLGERMLQATRALLMDEARQFPESGGYKRIPESWQPTALAEVAGKLEEQFGVPVRTWRIDNTWLDRQTLGEIEGLGRAFVIHDDPRQMPPPFVEYVFSAGAFDPAPTNPLARLRLQAKLPSHALADFDSNLYLFRLIEAQKTRAPESLDEVREQAEADARKVLAYRTLLAEKDAWIQRLTGESFEAIALEAGVTVRRPAPFTKGSRMAPPVVEGVGASRAFIEAVFTVAERFADPASLKAAPSHERITAVGLDHQLELALVRVDDFIPIPRSRYLTAVADPTWKLNIYAELLGDRFEGNPLTLEALIRRTGFRHAGESDSDQPDAAQARADGDQG